MCLWFTNMLLEFQVNTTNYNSQNNLPTQYSVKRHILLFGNTSYFHWCQVLLWHTWKWLCMSGCSQVQTLIYWNFAANNIQGSGLWWLQTLLCSGLSPQCFVKLLCVCLCMFRSGFSFSFLFFFFTCGWWHDSLLYFGLLAPKLPPPINNKLLPPD